MEICQCSYCKKFESEDGTWKSTPPAESFSEWDVTDSICPDCKKAVFENEGLEAA